MSKKVLYISPNGYFGGAERFVLNACIGHLKHGEYEPTILFFNDGEFRNMAEKERVSTYVLKNSFKLSSPFRLLKAIKEIEKYISASDFDVINSTMPYSQIVINLAKKKKNILSVWFQHGPVGGTLDKICSKFNCDHIYFNSEYLRQEHYNTVNQKKLLLGDSIIQYGIDNTIVEPEVRDFLRKKYINKDEKILILAAGRICEWKGYHNIIDALNELKEQEPELISKIKFVLIGEAKRESDKAYFEQIKSSSQSLQDNGIIQYESFKTNIKDYYRMADIFIHSSTIPEPFGLVVAEAMAQGTLVIGGSHGGVTDILKNDNTGYNFDAHTSEAKDQLVKILKKIIKKEISSEHMEKLCQNAINIIEKNHTILSMNKRLEASYDQLRKQKSERLNGN